MSTRFAESNKVKIAKRVVEVLGYLSETDEQITVNDIVREFKRPQSSTSELLLSLAELGLLYRDPKTRKYAPTVLMASFGYASQPEVVRSGRLFALMDDLAQNLRCDVGLFSTVGINAQIVRWSSYQCDSRSLPSVRCGAIAPMSHCSVGSLLLSALGLENAKRLLWRLCAEAGEEPFQFEERLAQVAKCGETGYFTAEFGFGSSDLMTAVHVLNDRKRSPLVLGVLHSPSVTIDGEALGALLKREVRSCVYPNETTNFQRRMLVAV